MKKMKKLITLGLALTMIMAMCVPAFADNEIDEAGGSAAVPVMLTNQAAVFSAEVPTSFPVSVDEYGEVTVATNLKIVNNSNGQIKVSSIQVSGVDGWQIAAYTTDYERERTDAKMFGMMINGREVATTGAANISNFTPINGNDEAAVTYDVTLPNLSGAHTSTHIADAVFTLAWNT